MSELEKIPSFTAAATSDRQIDSQELTGKKVIIYFYPKDNTPGCTQEGQEFSENYPQFENHNTVIFGVSKDSLRVHENFRKKHSFAFDLISDPEETLCRKFDVIKLKKLYGKEYMGIERSTFLFDEKGQLQRAWRKVKVKGHVDEVLEEVKGMD